MERPTPTKDAAVHRLAKSITQLTLCQITASEVDDATKLLEKAQQKLQDIQNIPSQRVNDLEATTRQLRQIGCILDSCTISASYEVTQRRKPYCSFTIQPGKPAHHQKNSIFFPSNAVWLPPGRSTSIQACCI